MKASASVQLTQAEMKAIVCALSFLEKSFGKETSRLVTSVDVDELGFRIWKKFQESRRLAPPESGEKPDNGRDASNL